MLVPFSWLKEYVAIDEEAEEVAEKLLLSGTKVEKILKEGDETVFELEITPNRPDCLGVIGVPREVAALYEKPLKIQEPFANTKEGSKQKRLRFTVKDRQLCPYYSIGVIDAVKIQESPEWLKKRLTLVGVRPINNVVDITNYVMISTGQPMHAFDYDKINGEMLLRAAKEGEVVKTLDGIERKLASGTIIIEDTQKTIDLAGIMGGENSQVGESTSTIILHVPVYNPVAIRKASQFLGIRTEASNRFEKELDPNGHRFAFETALNLLRFEASGELVSEIKSAGYPVKSPSFTVLLEKINAILGVKIPEERIVDILVRLGFEILPSPSTDGRALELQPPTWRPDIQITEDVAEEVGRIWGYNLFPRNLPEGEIPTHEDSFLPDWEKLVREILTSSGFSETYSHSMISASSINNFGLAPENCLKVSNRMVIDHEYLRPTLLLGLLQAVSLNLGIYEAVSLYEFGRVFSKNVSAKDKLPFQPRKVAALSTKATFAKLKGVLEEILHKFQVKDYRFEKESSEKVWSPVARLIIKKEEIGYIGRIEGSILRNFSVDETVFGFEIDFDKLIKHASSKNVYNPPPRLPVVKEDLSIAVEANLYVQEILNSISSLKERRLYKVMISEVIPWQGKKSILLKFEYYDPRKTLTDSEAKSIRGKIINILTKSFGAEIRSK